MSAAQPRAGQRRWRGAAFSRATAGTPERQPAGRSVTIFGWGSAFFPLRLDGVVTVPCAPISGSTASCSSRDPELGAWGPVPGCVPTAASRFEILGVKSHSVSLPSITVAMANRHCRHKPSDTCSWHFLRVGVSSWPPGPAQSVGTWPERSRRSDGRHNLLQERSIVIRARENRL